MPVQAPRNRAAEGFLRHSARQLAGPPAMGDAVRELPLSRRLGNLARHIRPTVLPGSGRCCSADVAKVAAAVRPKPNVPSPCKSSLGC